MRMRAVFVAVAMLAGFCTGASVSQAASAIPVCVAKDGTMRIVGAQTSCPAGQKRRLFAEFESDAKKAEDKATRALEQKIAELNARIAAMEARQPQTVTSEEGVTRVSAPFEVVGSDGTVILRVATQAASPNGARVTIGGGSANNYALRVFKGNQLIAGWGESTTGGGLGIVMDNSGQAAVNIDGPERAVKVFKNNQLAAGISAPSTGGIVAVYAPGGQPIAFLTRSSGGDGGNVTTALNNGFGVFSAGAAQDGGGEACVSRITQAGTPRLACVGLGLPSAGMGK